MEANKNKRILERTLGIKFHTCKSSNIAAFGFDASKGDIWILFKKGLIYKYEGQTQEKYEELYSTDSKGKWVNENLVKTQAKCQRYRIYKPQ